MLVDSANDSLVTCNFTVDTVIYPMWNGQTFMINLAQSNLHLLLAMGTMSGTVLSQHERAVASPELNLTSLTVVIFNFNII